MTRKGNHNEDKTRQPTWLDVSTTIRALEAMYGGHVEVSFDVEGAGNTTGALWVYAKLYKDFRPMAQGPVDVVRTLWPTHKCREMPSLVFRMLHQLDHAADARKRAEAAVEA